MCYCALLMHLPLNLLLKVVVPAAVAEMLGSELGSLAEDDLICPC